MIYTAQSIQQHETHRGPDWKPARPVNHTCDTWAERLRHAWGVLTGTYDALDWEDRVDAE